MVMNDAGKLNGWAQLGTGIFILSAACFCIVSLTLLYVLLSDHTVMRLEILTSGLVVYIGGMVLGIGLRVFSGNK